MADFKTAYLGLGGNVGDVIKSMNSTLHAFDKNQEILITKTSNVYKTPPWGITEQDWFLNACISVQTTLTAHQLLKLCLDTEKQLKRVRDVRWGPRTIDLDVLFYDNLEIDDNDLQLPHPRMHERAFVLMPLADIAPHLELHGKSIKKWLKTLDTSKIKKTDCKLTV